jgi:subtilisin family serine protease
MSKLIVIPHPSFLAGLPMVAAAESVIESGLRGLLDHRRQSLRNFATLAAKSALGLAVARGLVGAEAAAPEPLLLEALGMLIMDEAWVDRVVLEGALHATVLENVLIPLVKPTAQAGGAQPGAAAAALPWHLTDINIAAARAKNLDGSGQLVGVLDTGIDPSHPEFAHKTVHFMEFDANGHQVQSAPHDSSTHGTHVSGLIGGRTMGVAPAADIAMAAVLTFENSGYLAQIAAGLNWLLTANFRGLLLEPGVDVVNASLGSTGYNNYLYQALANARLITGTVMAAAIGDFGQQGINHHCSPGNYDITVGVGAIDRSHDVAPLSDWGKVIQHWGLTKPDLCAPGVDVTSSMPGGIYGAMTGTSMSTPIVTGALALLLQRNPTLTLNAAGLISSLYALVAPLQGSANQTRGGRGRLDLTAI